MSKVSRFVRNLGLIGIGRVSIQAVALLLLPALTGNLNPAQYGTAELIVTYVAICAPLVSLQLEMAVFRFLIAARNDAEESKATISTAAVPIAIFILFWAAAGFALGYLLDYRWVWYFTANLISMILFNVVTQIARGVGRNALFAVGNIVVAVATLVAVLLTINLSVFSLEIYLLVLAGANTASFLAVSFALRLYRFCNFRLFSFSRLKKLLKYSLPLIPNALSWWVISASGRTVAVIFLGVYYVGILAAASKFAAIVTGISTVFSLAWMEAASVSIDDSDRPVFFSKVVNQALRFFAALTILIIGAVPIMMNFLVDDSFAEAYSFAPILLIGAFGHSMVSFYSGVLIAQNKTGKVANTSIVSAVISLAISLIFVHWFGLYAIVFSTAVAFFFMVIYRQVLLQRELHIKYSVSALVTVMLGFAVVLVLYYLRVDSIVILLASAVISLILVIPAALFLLRTAYAKGKNRGRKQRAVDFVGSD